MRCGQRSLYVSDRGENGGGRLRRWACYHRSRSDALTSLWRVDGRREEEGMVNAPGRWSGWRVRRDARRPSLVRTRHSTL